MTLTVPDLPAHEPMWAYFLGLLATDGCHSGNLNGKGRISIELSERDADILQALHDVLPVKTGLTTRTRTTNFAKDYTSTRLDVFDQTLRRQVADLGYGPGPKSWTVRHPTWNFSERDFVRGLVDGDGSLGITSKGVPFVSFVTVSQPLADYYCGAIADEMWVMRKPGRNVRDGAFNIMLTGRNAALFARWLYEPGDLAMARKAARARVVIAEGDRNAWDNSAISRRAWREDEDLLFLSCDDATLVDRLGRSLSSIQNRRFRLHVRQRSLLPSA